MNFEWFTVRRILSSEKHKGSVSAPIIKIAIAAIAAGMTIMILSVATGIGLQQKIRQKVESFNGTVTLINLENQGQIEDIVPWACTPETLGHLSEIEGVAHVQATAHKPALILTQSDFEGIVLKGVGPEYDWDRLSEFLIQGRWIDPSDDLNNQIVISKSIAQRLSLTLDANLNTYFLDQVASNKDALSPKTRARGFNVVGIYDSGFDDFDSQMVFVDIRHIQRLNRWSKDEIGRLEVLAKDNFDVELLTRELYDLAPVTVDAVSMYASYFNIFEWLSLFDFNIYLIIIIMIIVATINMVTALIVLILERSRMIGIFQAMGAGNWRIQKIFLLQAAYIVLWGLFWGNLFGLTMVWVQDTWQWIQLDPQTYYVRSAPVHLPLISWAFLNLGTFVLCLLFLLIPSYLVAKISPVRALRFDG
ncbi:MAG TPA: transmembrane permease [Flavobacteriaceae bacterium]|nr:transmembrane permease [Flavobacteriaceae bacterium]